MKSPKSSPSSVLPRSSLRRQFNICYTARITGGHLAISNESTEIRFVDPGELDSLPMHHTRRLRIGHYLEKRDSQYLG
jgi:hypothetical protein